MSVDQPILFISYCWSSPEHEAWVLDLATQLTANGVKVLFDKWDLREGQDSVAFMERMVTDPSVTHVAMISDALYAAKADGRSGGVGTETTIISKRIYDSQDNRKFVAVIPSRDEHGRVCVPTYYTGRIYIDLSPEADQALEFERLLRWVFDKPLYVRPEIGERPAFLADKPQASLGTEVLRQRVEDSLRNGKSYAVPAVEEYLDKFLQAIDVYALPEDAEVSFEILRDSINETALAKNEFVRVISLIAQFDVREGMISALRVFFEGCIALVDKDSVGARRDPVKFLIGEIFLYTVAVLLKRERFAELESLLSPAYYSPSRASYNEVLRGYWDLHGTMESEESLSKDMNKLSARAALLKGRADAAGFNFDSLIQADVLLWLRSKSVEGRHAWWYASTLIYSSRFTALEIFARSTSTSYFEKIRPLIGVRSKEDLLDAQGPWGAAIAEWRLGGNRPNFYHLLNLENLCGRG